MKRRRVLIADGDYLVCLAIRRWVEEVGHKVVGMAGDGWEAVKLAKRLRPDLVLVDSHLPGLNGVEVTGQIRACCKASVLVLDAYPLPELVSAALAAGAGAALSKPMCVEEMRQMMAHFTGS